MKRKKILCWIVGLGFIASGFISDSDAYVIGGNILLWIAILNND